MGGARGLVPNRDTACASRSTGRESWRAAIVETTMFVRVRMATQIAQRLPFWSSQGAFTVLRTSQLASANFTARKRASGYLALSYSSAGVVDTLLPGVKSITLP